MPAKEKTPGQAVSTLMGGNASGSKPIIKQQSSITSFFQKKPTTTAESTTPNTPDRPSPAEKRGTPSAITPLAQSTDALRIHSDVMAIDDDDQMMIQSDDLMIDEDEMIQPASAAKKHRAARIIDDDEEDEAAPLGSSQSTAPAQLPSSPTIIKPKSAKGVPPSPLALRKPLKATPAKTLLSRSTDDVEDDFGRPASNGEGRYDWLVKLKDANGNPPSNPNYDPRTLFIPPSAWSKFTPFEKQFWEIKSRLMDTVVFFKKGKFYELYEGDADIGAQMFDLKMTDRVNMRMVGVPEATFDWWAGKFVGAGYRIARVDQTETSISKGMKDRETKGKADKIIKRELSTILTAGTLVDPGLLVSDNATYCMSLREEAGHVFGIAFVDAATATFKLASIEDDQSLAKLSTLLMQVRPKELLVAKGKMSSSVMKLLKDLLPDSSIIQILPDKEFWDARRTGDELDKGGYTWPDALRVCTQVTLSAFGGLLWYLRELKLDGQLMVAPEIELYDPVRKADRLVLDAQTLINLDILPSGTGPSAMKGTLLGLLDKCCTPFGRRLLRIWVCHPLRNAEAINKRLDVVQWLMTSSSVMNSIQKDLAGFPDLERILSRIHAGSVKVKDFLLVLESFQRILGFVVRLSQTLLDDDGPQLLKDLLSSLPDFEEPLKFFFTAFDHDMAKREGNVVPAPGVHEGYDGAQKEFAAVQQELADYLKAQAKILKCSNIKYKDLGKELYQIEVPASVEVPAEYLVMSKTKAVTRYWTPTIKELVRRFQEAEVRRSEALGSIFADILKQFGSHGQVWRKVVMAMAELDCLLSLAKCSAGLSEPKCRATFFEPAHQDEAGVLEMEDLRHPCIPPEREASFIPNTVNLGSIQSRMVVLTGPNMGGKSTLLRQTCLAAVMAQIGCWIPATSCRLSPVDRIFTRLGANDNILAGQSTFMVELTETSRILHEATHRSLVILDELGRGTSTFDGLAIAQAVLAYLVERIRCMGLFATHYRQLAVDLVNDQRVACSHMACDADNINKRITFLYKLTPGISPKSYGMNVAALAGIPREIIDEADLVSQQFEACLSISEKSHTSAAIKAIDLFALLLSA